MSRVRANTHYDIRGIKRQILLRIQVLCGWMEVGIGMKNRQSISRYLHIYAYVFVLSVLFMAANRKALRLSVSCSNWHVNHLSVGGISL